MAVSLDPRLMEILACPSDDHAPLRPGTPTDPDADVLTCTGPPGTMVFADTSGFHRGGWTRAKPRILSYCSYVSTKFRLEPRFEVDWSAGNGLSPEAEFAVSWSR